MFQTVCSPIFQCLIRQDTQSYIQISTCGLNLHIIQWNHGFSRAKHPIFISHIWHSVSLWLSPVFFKPQRKDLYSNSICESCCFNCKVLYKHYIMKPVLTSFNSLLWLFWILIQKPNALAILLGSVSISNLIGKSVRLFGEKRRKHQPEKLNWAQQLINTKFPPGCHDLFIKRSSAITTQFMYSIPILLTKCSVNVCTESPMLLTKGYVCCIL